MRRSGTTCSPSIKTSPLLERYDQLTAACRIPLQLRTHFIGKVPDEDGDDVRWVFPQAFDRCHDDAGPGHGAALLGRVLVHDVVDRTGVDAREVEQDGRLGGGPIAGERLSRGSY